MSTSIQAKAKPLADKTIVVRAIVDSFAKLHPRTMMKNPVMFVVEVGAVLTTLQLVRDTLHHTGAFGFGLQITLWLWFTVLFANFAEAMAEGRGKAQAETLRKARAETQAHRLRTDGSIETVPSSKLRSGDVVVVSAGEIIPMDGEVIEGVATVNESAITGESAPVIRESGGDRSAVTGGTTVLSDWIKVRITARPGSSFLDRMIALVEGAQRQKTPNEVALNILLAGMTLIFLFVVVTIPSFARYAGGALSGVLLVALFLDKTGTITLGNRQAAEFLPVPGVTDRELADAAQLASLSDDTPEGRSVVVLAKEKFGLRGRDMAPLQAHFVPFTAQTRMSGIDVAGSSIRKGAVDSVLEYVQQIGGGRTPAGMAELRAIAERIAKGGGTPLAGGK